MLFIDGIVHVTAKDKATNKDQSMTIASSSGLSDKDIERMVSESEQYAEADKARKLVIEESNRADSVCADTEKGAFPAILLQVYSRSSQRWPSSRTNSRAASARRVVLSCMMLA